MELYNTSMEFEGKDTDKMMKTAQQAFEQAIASGRLSADPSSANYAGDFMYMGPKADGSGDCFKHSTTREYLA